MKTSEKMEEDYEKPFRVEEITGVGVCLIATRDIPPLSIILADNPAVVAPNQSSPPVCLGCLQSVDGSTVCPVCSYPMCSVSCCTSSVHTQECGVLQGEHQDREDSGGVNYQIVAVIRLLSVRETDSQVWAQIDELMDHEEERRQDVGEWKMSQRDVVDVIKRLKNEVDDDLIHRLIGLLSINCVGVSLKKERIQGRALYPLLSLVSHSCVANARYAVNPEDFSVVLRAKRDILEGEEITINYLPHSYGVPKRKMEITNQWYFDCKCPRCSDVTEFGTFVSALKCTDCREGLIMPEDSREGSLWRCRFCMNPFESAMIQKMVQNLEDQLHDISTHNHTVKSFETFIRKNSQYLHLKHYLNLIAQRHIIELLSRESKITREACKKIIRLSKSYMSIMSRLDPGYSQWMGSVLKKLNKAQLELLKSDLKENLIDRNEFVTKSEEVWKSMKDVDSCDVLCKPVQGRRDNM
eukprot:GFUD01013291.1.p1 GENE.GFUD01013291.1~~GFUD01013291.1.p1  ORF type:complete len:467 (+),score=105.34 GFUD01013291.1:105-1505(+)